MTRYKLKTNFVIWNEYNQYINYGKSTTIVQTFIVNFN